MSDKKIGAVAKSAVIKNPVLFEAIGIAPVVAMATSLKTAIMLTAITLIQMTVIELFACKFLKMLKSRFRVLVYAVLGVLINIPLFSVFSYFTPNEAANVSIFLPIIAVNSLIALHCERFAVRHSIKETFVDSLASGMGYGLIVLLTGTVREIFGSGTIYGIDLGFKLKFSGLLLPFGGFLALGYISAVFKRIIKRLYPGEKPEEAFNLSEISQSHFDNIKNLFNEDFNPFDEEAEAETETLNPFADIAPVPEKRKKSKKALPNLKHGKSKRAEQKESKYEIIIENGEDFSAPAEERRDLPSETGENIISDSKKYESEFDDLLSELEVHKKKKEKDGDGE